jgi:hypothetical protein
MQVMCVLEANTIVKSGVNDAANVHIGNEYTVVDTIEYGGEEYFKLSEVPGAYFSSKLFAVLPDASADEMQEEKYEAIVNLETELV